MTTIWDAFQLMRRCYNATRGGDLTPAEASSFLEQGQQAKANAEWEKGIGARQSPSEALRPLIKADDTLATNSTGALTWPADLWHVLAIFDRSANMQITNVLLSELDGARASALRPITKYKRYYVLGAAIQIVPEAQAYIRAIYLRKLVAPVIGWAPDANGSPEYDATSSTQLELDTPYWPEIVRQALLYAGVNLSLEQVAALAQVPSGGLAPA